MAKIIAIANQKGGVGNTTTVITLAAYWPQLKTRILLVDIDPKANATFGLGIVKASSQRTSYHLLVLDEPIQNTILPTEFGLQIVPSDRNLAGAEIEMIDFPARELVLKKALVSLLDSYDFILVDCPPALNLLTLNGLAAADSLLIPIQCEFYALEGVSDLFNNLCRIRQAINQDLMIVRLFLTL